MITGFGNNIASALASDITANQTSITLIPGAGESFAKLLTTDISNPSSPHRVYAKLTLTDSQQTVFEICHLITVSNDTLTVIRGQEGTVAKGWALNDVIANFATRGSEQSFVQIEQLQGGDFTSATAGGTPNALAVSIPSTFSNNNTNDWLLKTPLFVTPIATNSGAATLQLTMGGRVLGTYPLVKGSNTALRAGDIVAKTPFLAVFNAEENRFIVLNPTTDVGSVRTVNSHAPDAAGNVKLGTAADADVGTAGGNVIQVGAFGLASSLPTLSSVNLDTFDSFGFYVVRDAINAPMDDKGVWFLSVRVWDSKSGVDPFRIVQIAEGYGSSGSLRNRSFHRVYSGSAVGWSTWVEFYSEAHKPTAQDTNALPITGGTLTGQLGINNADFINKNGYTTYTDGSGNQHRQAGGLRLTIASTILAELYYNETVGKSAELSFHNKYGSTDSYISLRNDGQFSVIGVNPQIIFSNGTVFAPDGNVRGSVWNNGYLSNWIADKAYEAQTNAVSYADNRAYTAEQNAISWANNNCVRGVSRGSQGSMTMDGVLVEAPAGCVLTGGNGNEGNQVGIALYRPLQILRGGSWQTIEG
jgi:hypothetical protein